MTAPKVSNGFFLTLSLLMGLLLISCSEDEFFEKNITGKALNTSIKEENMTKFARVLSKAVYERKDVRAFLKQESLKQFDKNYDVLYYLVKDEMIGEESFRDILISYSSVEDLEKIERSIPLLNIYVSKIEFFDVLPENLDTDDTEIPVIVSKKSENALFFNGIEELSFEKGEVPNFHVFVVNENSRVILPENSHSIRSRRRVRFRSPAFDGMDTNTGEDKLSVGLDDVGQKAIESFKYFFKDDGSNSQKGFQRDFIYYGITPENRTGSLNYSVTEYIQFLEIDPKIYYDISDQRNSEIYNGDPFINNSGVKRKSRNGYSQAELIDRMWSKGAYNFRFEIFYSFGSPMIVYAPLRPDQIWDFNIEHSYRHSTWFRKSKHTYKIDPSKFTSKRVVLPNPITIGRWDIRNESLTRYVKIYEEDEGLEQMHKEIYEMQYAHGANFIGNTKISLGLKEAVNSETDVAGGVESPTTITKSGEIAVMRSIESDYLGCIKMYFYDPVLHDVSASTNSAVVHTYDTRSVKLGLVVK
ncbi:hypothetical protein ACFSKL_22920 [Belliella marina]|uniref:Major fimbrial subunit protein N-terminal domain-containing protein n=1 Tax=Belliella marina TaxID=1644146 RepID=A0ABW4VXM2_9BACT